ncbi:CheR family methyltransferase [Cytophagaceae bacterium ABcell3]|nr:CheR family methyltransferase [Cytophagaceae bacterium ABcell3]
MSKKDELARSVAESERYIIGVGFSAGGIDPLKIFFENTGHNNNSYVVIQHLPHGYRSQMKEMLPKFSNLKIIEIENGIEVQPGCVYLMPERRNITIEKGKLYMAESNDEHPNTAIDTFFKSMANDQKSKSIAVILSGSGTDGTEGAECVKNQGGLVVVQDPETALHKGMPSRVVDSGNAHLILSPEKMPGAIFNYISQFSQILKYIDDLNEGDEGTLLEILDLVKKVTPLDFKNYKRPTIVRRVLRRMVEMNISSLSEFKETLKRDPSEVEILSSRFLINVTHFFRDPEAFEVIKTKVVPEIVKLRKEAGSIKIWVVGCATGEEAYSLAIVIKEFFDEHHINLDVKIFATDVDKEAVSFASKGKYAKSISNNVSSDRLNVFFDDFGEYYCVKDDIRKMVIFANHDITTQPPYAKIDLLSCRNLLIYLNPVLQKKVISTLHYSLNLGGYLFLGPSESVGQLGQSFKEIDKKWKVYKNLDNKRSGFFSYPSSSLDIRNDFSLSTPMSKPVQVIQENNINELVLLPVLEETLYSAAIYIDEYFTIIKPCGNIEEFLLPKRFNFNLMELLPEELSIAVGTTVRKALNTKEAVKVKGINYRNLGKINSVNILVKPVFPENKVSNAIVFLGENETQEIKEHEIFEPDRFTKHYLNDLEEQLRVTKKDLQAAYSTIQSYNEHTHAYNEELVSSNEELQSTNEELQSINEELQTVNNEYQSKIKELAELNDDLDNYFNNSVNGQVFVDKNLIIRKFTPSASKEINLGDNNLGRSLSNISSNLKFEGMIDYVAKVISESTVCEKEVKLEGGKWFQMIIKPYIRQKDNRTDGAVITFNDITLQKQAQKRIAENAVVLRQKNEELTKINQDLDGFIYTASHDLRAPVSNIEGLLYAIEGIQDFESEELNRLYAMINESVVKLKGTIVELTEISKIQKSINNDVREVVFSELLDEVKTSLREMVVKNNAKIISNFDSCPRVQFSGKNMRSIIYNLLSNAIKYRSPKRTPEVIITSSKTEEYCMISVQDNGLGISKNKQDKMFSMFRRFHDHVEGTGIGLYMVKRIVENGGGRIEVESEPGKGAIFRVFLKV